ncbi:MAG: hypothetical protein WBA35_14245 [Litorimonas sp.]
MTKRLDLKKRVFDILMEAPNTRMTARQLATAIRERYPDLTSAKLQRSKAVTDEEGLIQQLVREIGAQRKALRSKYPEIKTVDVRPREYYFATASDEEEAEAVRVEPAVRSVETTQECQKSFTEHDLYPVLGAFAFEEFDCYAMRIDEKRSANRSGSGANQRLYPDVVGMVNLMKGWHRETSELAKAASAERVRFFSFEVKKHINRSNVRKCVFQTVSNSTWANFAYLVAASVDEAASAELRLLCSSHGIGFIRLDPKDASESQVLIPATLRGQVEWNALDRLTAENRDAQQYVENVRAFHGLGRVRTRDWDLVPS